MHRLAWVDPERIDTLARDFFIHALIDMGASYILYDDAEECIGITGLPARWVVNLKGRPTDQLLFGEDISARLTAMRTGLLVAGDQAQIDVELEDGGIFEFRCRKVSMPDQRLYVIMSINDKTEEKQREQVLRALLLEVSHRSRNMLAIVQGLASQSARYSTTLDGFLRKFRDRLFGLAKSQDLITDTSWRGANFNDLLSNQTAFYVDDHPLSLNISGDDVFLSPNATLNVGMALHELAVNVIGHHDLMNNARGLIDVDCRISNAKGSPEVTIVWQEHLPSKPLPEFNNADTSGRFGSIILEKVVPASLNGTARYSLDENGARYELVFPYEASTR